MTSPYAFGRSYRQLRLTCAMATLDVTALFAAFVVAYQLRLLDPKQVAAYVPFTAYASYVAVATPAWVLMFAACGLYATRQSYGRLSEAGRVVVAVGLGVMALIVLDYFSLALPLFPGRAVPAYAAGLGVVLVLLGRHLLRLVLGSLHRRDRALHNIVVVGTGELAERIAAGVLASGRGSSVVAAVDPDGAGGVFLGNKPVYATIEQALASHRVRVDEILQADTTLSRAESTRLMTLANDLGMGYRFIPDLYGVFAASSTMSTAAGVPVMEVRLTSLDGWSMVGKRVVDVVGSLAGILLLAPLFLAVAGLVKLTDPSGPVLYRQERLGRGGRRIGLFKFRSMLWEYSTGPDRPYRTAEEAFAAMGRPDLIAEFALEQKVSDDPRVSRVGLFLRRTSLDELPQLFNSLLGHVSLVGPRPITPGELERYGEHRRSFLALKPGITGLWQVSGRSDVGYDQRVKLDVFYAENWSTLLDVSILARTLGTVAARRGAV